MTIQNRPLNVIQITTHDTGTQLGCYGHRSVNTPNIDALATGGVRMTSYFAAAPICCASRASMLTGLYPQSHGLLDLCFAPFNWRINDDVEHLAAILARNGYRSLLFGIQHEAARSDAARLGFHQMRHADGLVPCGEIAHEVAAFLADEAGKPEGRPFYAQIGFFETHTPFSFGGATPDTERGVELPAFLTDDAESSEAMAAFQGALRNADAAVGTILDALRRSGLEDDTLVVYTTDHGIEVPRAKWTLYDPGIAVAMVMRCPAAGLTGGGTCDLLWSNVDYVPTIMEVLGLSPGIRFDGRSVLTALQGAEPEAAPRPVFAMYHKTQARCVRTREHKLIRYFDAATDYARVPVSYAEMLNKRGIPGNLELFDLHGDPNELHNLADAPDYRSIRRSLEDRLWAWMEETDDPILAGPVVTPSYSAAIADYRAWKGA